MNALGAWMGQNDRSIYGCTSAPEDFKVPNNCLLTYNPQLRRLYLHLLAWPNETLFLDGYA